MFVTVLFYLFVVGAIVVLGAGAFNLGRVALDNNRKRAIASEKSEAAAKQALGYATKALRKIANGAGAPELEAQIALDELETYHTKELN